MEFIIIVCFIIAVFPWFKAIFKAATVPGTLMTKLIVIMFVILFYLSSTSGSTSSYGDTPNIGSAAETPMLMLFFSFFGFIAWGYANHASSKSQLKEEEEQEENLVKKKGTKT